MGKKAAYMTIKGTYDPTDESQFVLVGANGVPQLALISEPLRTYEDSFDGMVFCRKVANTKDTMVKPSYFGGASVKKTGYSRSVDL